MGNVSLKVLEKSLNFLFKNRYKPCSVHPLSQAQGRLFCLLTVFVCVLTETE